MSGYKDLFSKQSGAYAKFRPTYPSQLIDYLASLSESRRRAWDCGTGNGQAALMLTQHFASVMATDPSREQLGQAMVHPKVEYRVAPAEESGLPDDSIDLTTVAQAFHWFKHKEFAKEVRRVSRAKGLLGVWCYGLATIDPSVDKVVHRLYENILGPFWEPERKLVDEGYARVQLPFQELSSPRFTMTADWSLDHLFGYLGTWSALQKYITQHGRNPIDDIRSDLKVAWNSNPIRLVRWELGVRVWRVRP